MSSRSCLPAKLHPRCPGRPGLYSNSSTLHLSPALPSAIALESILALRDADIRIRRIRHAAAISIHVPPSETKATLETRRAA